MPPYPLEPLAERTCLSQVGFRSWNADVLNLLLRGDEDTLHETSPRAEGDRELARSPCQGMPVRLRRGRWSHYALTRRSFHNLDNYTAVIVTVWKNSSALA